MQTHINQELVSSRNAQQAKIEPGISQSLMEMATHYHVKAVIHQQEGDHEKAARDIILALSYYKKAV